MTNFMELEMEAPRRAVSIVELDRTPVQVRGTAPATIWWRGKQWAVTSYGVELLNGTYAIEGNRLADAAGSWPVPLHMSEKKWVDNDEFVTAWMVGLLLHGHGDKVTRERLLEIFADLPSHREPQPQEIVSL